MRKPKIPAAFALLVWLAVFPCFAQVDPAQPPAPEPLKIGFVGSLTSFAASYGKAVLEGAQLAVEELRGAGHAIELTVEDDQSVAKNAVGAYRKLVSVDGVKGVIGGTWWANAFVKNAERDRIPLLSCETLYNDDVVLGSSYFLMQGDLREWVRVYEPVVATKGWKRGAIVHFVSGFGSTLGKEMKELFSKEGRTFVGALEYSDIELGEGADFALKLKALKPDVLYIDGQPRGVGNFLKRLAEAGLSDLSIMTNSIMQDIHREKLADLSKFKGVYFTKRASFDENFRGAFVRRYGKEPELNSDLGYYAVYLLKEAFNDPTPLERLKAGISVRDAKFVFDEHNVSAGVPQRVFEVRGTETAPVS